MYIHIAFINFVHQYYLIKAFLILTPSMLTFMTFTISLC